MKCGRMGQFLVLAGRYGGQRIPFWMLYRCWEGADGESRADGRVGESKHSMIESFGACKGVRAKK